MKKVTIVVVIFLTALLAVFYRPSISTEKLKQKYVSEYSKFIPVNGMDVHYHDRGTGTPLLLIHGTSSSLHTWGKWENELAKHFRVLSIDMPGGGLTGPHPDQDYSIDAYLDYLNVFTETLKLDSFYIAGNSLGGHIAWEYAARNEKIKKLVLVDPSGFFIAGKKPPLVFQLGRKKALSKVVEKLNVKPFIKKSLKEVFYDDTKVTADLVNRYNDFMRLKGNREAFFQKVNTLKQSKESDLQKIVCPTLIQWGADDHWIPIALADIFTANIANHEYIVYEKCGHVPQEEIPEQSVQDVIEFLNKN
jgi:pimeloyl-ACP methyl ester carboxylesterase